MAKLTLNNTTSGYQSSTASNANNDLIEAAVENTLSRDGTSPNQMGADLDMNSNDVLNATQISADTLVLGGVPYPAGTVAVTNSDTAPENPVGGQFWWKSDVGRLYVYHTDDDSSQWVETGGYYSTTAPADSSAVPHTPAGTGAIATTVKARLDLQVYLEDFGAVGDGVTDCSPALEDALELLDVDDQVEIRVGPGDFLLNSQVAYSSATKKYVKIVGAGPDVSRFIVPSSNTTGAISIDFTGVGLQKTSTVILQDFSVIADGEGLGTGIIVNNVAGGNLHKRTVHLQRVHVKGQLNSGGDNDTDYFTNGIDLTGCWRPFVDDCVIGGPFGTNFGTPATAYADASYLYKQLIGLNVDNCYHPEVHNCYIWSAATGISAQGTTEEGLRMSNTNIVECRTGLDFDRTGEEPTLWIDNCHINCRDRNIDIDGCKLVTISGVISYNQDTAESWSGAPNDIYLNNVTWVDISRCFFHFDGPTDRKQIQTGAAADHVVIRDCMFTGDVDVAVFISGTTTNVLLSNNTYDENVTYGTGRIVDNSSSLIQVQKDWTDEGEAAPGNPTTYMLESFASGALIGPSLALYKNSATPATSDVIGAIEFDSNDDGVARETYGLIRGTIVTTTAGSEDGNIQVFVQKAGTLTRRITFDETTINAVLPTYADNAAATTGGLVVGDMYQTSAGAVRIRV